MIQVIGYSAAALLPLLYVEVPDVVVNRWRWKYRTSSVPSHIEQRVATEARLAPFAAITTLGLILWWLVSYTGISPFEIGINSKRWRLAFLTGVVAGVAWVLFYVCLLAIFRPPRTRITRHLLVQHSARYWVLLGLAAAAGEEVWRGFCLVALRDHGQTVGLVATAVAAGWAHLHPRARAASAAAYALYAGGLFFVTHSLWATIPSHIVVNLGTVWIIRVAARD